MSDQIHSYQLTCELWVSGDYSHDEEVIVTAGKSFGKLTAAKIFNALFPEYECRNVEVNEQ